jgi:hypothetical protein
MVGNAAIAAAQRLKDVLIAAAALFVTAPKETTGWWMSPLLSKGASI